MNHAIAADVAPAAAAERAVAEAEATKEELAVGHEAELAVLGEEASRAANDAKAMHESEMAREREAAETSASERGARLLAPRRSVAALEEELQIARHKPVSFKFTTT